MPVFESTLPAFPDGVGDKFVIVYDSTSGIYYLENQFYQSVHYNSTDDFYYIIRYSNNGSTQRWNYYNDDRGWVHVGGLHTFTDPIILTGSRTLIYSSIDLIYNGNVWYSADTPERISLVSDILAVNGSISSSTIYKSLMSDVLPVLGVVFLTVIGCIAFRKGWNFFSNILSKG